MLNISLKEEAKRVMEITKGKVRRGWDSNPDS
jgi:hypothetical protein